MRGADRSSVAPKGPERSRVERVTTTAVILPGVSHEASSSASSQGGTKSWRIDGNALSWLLCSRGSSFCRMPERDRRRWRPRSAPGGNAAAALRRPSRHLLRGPESPAAPRPRRHRPGRCPKSRSPCPSAPRPVNSRPTHQELLRVRKYDIVPTPRDTRRQCHSGSRPNGASLVSKPLTRRGTESTNGLGERARSTMITSRPGRGRPRITVLSYARAPVSPRIPRLMAMNRRAHHLEGP